MIRQVTITEFAPDGMTFFPINLSVDDLDFLESRKITSGTIDLDPKPVKATTFVVAGNQCQFHQYCQARGLRKGRDVTCVMSDRQLHGLCEATFILTGTYTDRHDWPSIERTIRYIPEAIVKYDPY